MSDVRPRPHKTFLEKARRWVADNISKILFPNKPQSLVRSDLPVQEESNLRYPTVSS